MNDPKVKQQIANKIKDASNILVTVNNNPSVDELSAALGLTLLLNKMEKHATAVFSGKVPPAITFLDPEKTFEETTDSLRDFIIALDKEKADHLRYKLEGDLVKIYITPYRTTISSDDLEYSQGDYNVELVIALGVEDKNHLDAALDDHGKILHNATVVTVTAGDQVSNLGSIDWHESNASSLSEMLVTLHDSLKLDKNTLDKSISTAWMTGIVSATERFSNPRTTSRVMSIASQLMAAGADQQLIAAQLESAASAEESAAETEPNGDGRTDLSEGKKARLPKKNAAQSKDEQPRPDGELVINHDKDKDRAKSLQKAAATSSAERLEESARAAQRALEKQEELAAAAQTQEAAETPASDPVEPPAPQPHGPVDYSPSDARSAEAGNEPVYGGTLNATSGQAAEDKRRAIAADKNKVILSHSNYLGGGGPQDTTHNESVNQSPGGDQTPPAVDVFKDAKPTTSSPVEPPSAPTAVARNLVPPSQAAPTPAPAPEPAPAAAPQTLADLDAQHRAPQAEAMAAVEAALSAAPDPMPPATPVASVPEAPGIPPLPSQQAPADFGLPLPPPPPPPASAFASGAGMPPLPPAMPGNQTPERLGDIFAPEQQPPSPSPMPAAPSAPADPGQFHIPGQ